MAAEKQRGVRIVQRGPRSKCALTASLFVLVLALVGCAGSESQPSSEAESSPGSSTETNSSTTPGGEPSTGETPPSQTAQAAQQVVDRLTGADAEEAYARALQATHSAGEFGSCEPTQPDMLGPYYVPDAPLRSSVDTGYVLSGNVLSAGGCEPLSGAQIEFWLADSRGNYDDANRATVLAGEQGEYQFQSNFPGLYENRPRHIHVRVTAPGFQELVTQHYPNADQAEAAFNLVLEPA